MINNLFFFHLNSSRYAVSGGIAGFIQSFLLCPIELIKIKMQLTKRADHLNVWTCTRGIINSSKSNFECIRSLMRGINLTLIRDVPAISAYFVGFEFLCNSFQTNRNNLSVSHLLLAGGLSGCISWLLTYPIDVVKTRFQADTSYKTVYECYINTVKSQGYIGFWRGITPTLFRFLNFEIYFTIFKF
jgi:solute carrier family 25 (mitochondrial carnitine/acylcarnitine transporter), member 20/29